MFEAVSRVVLSAPKALHKTGLDLVNFGLFYGSKTFLNPLDQRITVLPPEGYGPCMVTLDSKSEQLARLLVGATVPKY
jgi:hypothetical protein